MLHTGSRIHSGFQETIKSRALLSAIILFFIVSNLIWFSMDCAPPMWDQAHYLWSSEILYHELSEKGFLPFMAAFTEILQIKAPLITVLPVPFYILFGNTYASALYVNLVFMIFAGYFLYKLGVSLSGEKEALLSVFILNLFPLIIGVSRQFLTEYGLMTFVIIWMYYLLRADAFEKIPVACILGIILGLGMLMKISFILYILGPTLFVLIKRTCNAPATIRLSLANIAIAAAVGILIAGPWYYKNLSAVINFAFSSGYGHSASKWAMGEVFSLGTILSYWTYLGNYAISAYFFLLLFTSVSIKIIASILQKPIHIFGKSSLPFLAAWFFFPFILFTFGINKDYRYAVPYLPAVALVIGIFLARITRMRFGNILLSALLLFPLIHYFFLSFSFNPVQYEIGKLKIFKSPLAYAYPPVREKWPLEKIVEILSNDAGKNKWQNLRISLLFDHKYINFINLNYYAENRNLEMVFDHHDYFSAKNQEEIIDIISSNSSYVITKSDKLGPDLSGNKNIKNVMSMLADGRLNFKKIETVLLPDGTATTIYRKI